MKPIVKSKDFRFLTDDESGEYKQLENVKKFVIRLIETMGGVPSRMKSECLKQRSSTASGITEGPDEESEHRAEALRSTSYFLVTYV